MNKLFRISLWVLVALGVPALLFNIFSLLLIAPALVLPSLALAAAFIAVFLFLLRLSPMWARPAAGWVSMSLLWGSGTAVGLALLSSGSVLTLAAASGWEDSLMSWAGAYPEEIAKAAGVFFVLLSFRQLNRPWHGWVVGATIGMGFEALENINYGISGGIMHPTSDWIGMWQTWGIRLMAGPGLHILLTGLAGWGIGWAIYAAYRPIWWRLAMIFGYLALAFVLHFAWNYMVSTDLLLVIKAVLVALVLYPLSFYLIVHGNLLARRDTSYSYSSGEESLRTGHTGGFVS